MPCPSGERSPEDRASDLSDSRFFGAGEGRCEQSSRRENQTLVSKVRVTREQKQRPVSVFLSNIQGPAFSSLQAYLRGNFFPPRFNSQGIRPINSRTRNSLQRERESVGCIIFALQTSGDYYRAAVDLADESFRDNISPF